MTRSDRIDILLVEDSPHERELTLRALKKGSDAVRIHAVEDGVQALDFLLASGQFADRSAEALPRLVLLDLKLPKLNGLEVLRRIRASNISNSVPVVMLSSSQEDRDIAASYELGVNSYTVKPLDFEEFVHCIAKIRDFWLTCNRLPG